MSCNMNDTMNTSDIDGIDRAATQLGFSTWKEEQREVVKNFVRGNDAFVALPTGFGKSFMLCCAASCF